MDWLILTLSLAAGVFGTGLGGLIGVLLKNRGARVMGRVLGFAGGVMAGVVAFEMIPESISSAVSLGKGGAIATSVATVIGGMAVIFAVNKLLDYIEKKRRRSADDVYRASAMIQAHTGRGGDIKREAQNAVICRKDGLNIATDSINIEKRKIGARKARLRPRSSRDGRSRAMIKAGTVMFIAIALHNFPEGMAIGASGTLQTQMGILIALIIAIHNVPEGMAIAAPLVSGGVHGAKAVALTALAGCTTVIGAVFGLAVGGLGELATGICLSLASGAMLYVTVCDILPQSIALNNGEAPSVSMLTGLVFSIVFVFAI